MEIPLHILMFLFIKLRAAVIFFLLFVYSQKSFGQIESIKFDKYFKIAIGAFNLYNTRIENFNSGKILEYYKTPSIGISIQSEYQKNHLFFSYGFSFKILPTGYKFKIRNRDLFNRENYPFDFEDKVSEYFYKIYSLPLSIGYQTNMNNANQRFWINSGTEINFIKSGRNILSFSYDDANSNTFSVVESIIDSDTEGSNGKYFLTYQLGLGLTSILKGGNQIKYGLKLNISNQNLIEGRYQVNLKNRVERGTYRDDGSFYGFEASYSFKKNKPK